MGAFDEIHTNTILEPDGFWCTACPTPRRSWLGASLQTKDLDCDMRSYAMNRYGLWRLPDHRDDRVPRTVTMTGSIDALGKCEKCGVYVDFRVDLIDGVPHERQGVQRA